MNQKTYHKLIRSIYFNQAVGVIWGLVLSMVFLTFMDEFFGLLISTMLALVIIMSGMYSICFHQGFRDRNTCHMHELTPDRLLGLKAGLWASIVNVIVMLGYLFATYVFTGTFVVMNIIARVWFMPYSFLFNNYAQSIPYVVFPIILILIPLFCCFGYYMGLKDIRIFEKLVYKKNPNQNR